MEISLNTLQHGKILEPPRIILYGPQKVGKSTTASKAPKPIFIQTEDGSSQLDVTRTPLCTRFDEVMGWLRMLFKEEHDYKTLVLDSLDWTEKLIHEQVRQEQGDNIFAEYGRGFTLSLGYIDKLITALNAIRAKRGMAIILLAHSKIKKFEAPDTAGYDRYQLDLHDKAASVFVEWSDAILFTSYRVFAREEKGAFNTRVTKAVGDGERVVYTSERPAYVAGNRYQMPHELPLEWRAVEQAIYGKTQLTTQQQEA